MAVSDVEIKYLHYGGFNRNDMDKVVHVKQLPYLSIVQSKIGSYGIKLNKDAEQRTEECGFFIAPSFVTQKITHFNNEKKGTFCSRYIFIEITANKENKFEDMFSLPVVPDRKSTEILDAFFDELDSAENVCDRMRAAYGMVSHLMKISEEKELCVSGEIYKLTEYIKNNYMKNITVKELADMAKMSESNLYAAFKKATGISPVRYINDYRLYVASELLSHTEYTVAEIAYKVGIGDSFYFSKQFGKKYGVPPSKFRKVKYY